MPGGRSPLAPGSGQGKVGYQRLDVLLHQRGLAPSRERARALILAGDVRVDGRIVAKAGALVAETARIELTGPGDETRFVSRGGLKLERALDRFALEPRGRVCLDVGASTGGFTDVLLRRGAARVYAVDVGHGQLAWTLRNDPRVVVRERTNIRYLMALPEPVALAVVDVSFISLRLVLPPVAHLLAAEGAAIALVKPQFEAGRAEANRGAGVIADPEIHRRVLVELLQWLAQWRASEPMGALAPRGLIASPITGRDGNHEYLLALDHRREQDTPDPAQRSGITRADVDRAVVEAFARADT